MHNRQSTQSYEYDSEFLLKALASLFFVSVSITLIYNRNSLFVAGANLKNYAGELKARFFGPKPADAAPPTSVPYKLIDGTPAATLNTVDEKLEQSSGSDSDTPTNLQEPTATVAPAGPEGEAEVKAADAGDTQPESPPPGGDFVDAAEELQRGREDDEREKAQLELQANDNSDNRLRMR